MALHSPPHHPPPGMARRSLPPCFSGLSVVFVSPSRPSATMSCCGVLSASPWARAVLLARALPWSRDLGHTRPACALACNNKPTRPSGAPRVHLACTGGLQQQQFSGSPVFCFCSSFYSCMQHASQLLPMPTPSMPSARSTNGMTGPARPCWPTPCCGVCCPCCRSLMAPPAFPRAR